ncbi:glutaredoxin family protein [Microvirga sp. GCM10011540]|uniref:glutaredoxin family protein n=1 Tax=Microvirga sp. GCM10011540 TaxID=3317338 RepID=UPI0036191250
MTRMNSAVTLYTTPECSDCNLLKGWLKQMGIPFDEQRLSYPTGTRRSDPLTVVDGHAISGPLGEQKRAIFEALTMTVLG